MQTRPGFFRRHLRTIGALVFVSLYSVSISFATPPTTPYQPGATLDPSCTPGSTNCSVQILPAQTGNANKYLTTDGSVTSWSTNTLILGGNFTTSGNYATTLTTTGTTTLTLPTTGTVATTANINSAVSGTTNYIPKFTGTNTIGNSSIYDTGTSVGVGTTTPARIFTINGAGNSSRILLQTTASGASIADGAEFAQDTSGNTDIWNYENGYIRFGVNNVEQVRILANGRVGIGTATPTRKLEVSEDVSGSGVRILSLSNANPFLQLSNGSSEWYTQVLSDAYTITRNASNFVTVANAGNVGIGTTTPGYRLEVKKTSSGSALNLIGDAVGTRNDTGIDFSASNSTTIPYARIGLQITTASLGAETGGLAFSTISDGAFSEKMFIQGNGRVGIGTTTPNFQLEVAGSLGVTNGSTILRNTSATGYATLRLYNNQDSGSRALEIDYSGSSYASSLLSGGPTGESAAITTTGAYPLVFGTSNTARLTIDSSGNIVIPDLAGSGNRCVYADSTGQLNVKGFDCGSASGGDNLGDHTATQNVILGTNWLSGDGGNEGIRIDASGNVGVGTATPNYRFGVHTTSTDSYMQITSNTTGTTATDGLLIGTGSAGDAIILNRENTNIRFENGGGEVVRFTSGGNVGIGTTAPLAPLQIGGAGTDTTIGGNSGSNIFANAYNAGGWKYIKTGAAVSGVGFNTNGSSTGDIGFYTAPSGTAGAAITLTNRMMILENGNIGIGITSPSVPLHVVASTNGLTGGQLTNTNTGTAAGARWVVSGDVANTSFETLSSTYLGTGVREANSGVILNNGSGTLNIAQGTTASTSAIRFFTNGTATANERMRITSTGYVGIGKTNPSALLHAEINSSTWVGKFVNTNTSTDNAGLLIQAGVNTGNEIILANKADGTNVFLVDASGKVGIGTIAPLTTLEVRGANSNYWNGSTNWTATPHALTITNTNPGGYDPVLMFRQAESNGTLATSGGIGLVGTGSWTSGNVSSQSSDMYFAVRNMSGGINERMRITSAGNVGVGTTAPVTLLQLASDTGSYTKGLLITSAAGNGTVGLSLWHDNGGFTNEYIDSRYDSASAAMNFRMRVNGTPVNAMTILGNGNVGIGTTNPTFLAGSGLEISRSGTATLKLNSTSGSKYFEINQDSTTAITTLNAAGSASQMVFQTANVERVRIDASGNIGIGTASPADKLDIVGGAQMMRLTNSADTTYSSYFGTRNDGHLQIYAYKTGTGAGYKNILIGVDSSTTNAGNVGIGITTPGVKLDVGGTVRSYAATPLVSAVSTNALNDAVVAASWTSGYGTEMRYNPDSAIGYIQNTYPTAVNQVYGDIQFRSYNGSSNVTNMIIKGYTGNVGIGNTSPGAKLDVSGSFRATGTGFSGATGYGAEVQIFSNAAYFQGYDRTGLTFIPTYFRGSTITLEGGPVSILNLTSCGGLQTNGSGTLSCTSDETLKDKHGAFTTGLSAIRNINPESFSWKEDSGLYDDGVIYYGFIAQNVQSALPEAISTSATGKLQVSQLTLLAASINAIKELDIQVQAIPSFEDQTLYAKVAEFLRGIAERGEALVDNVTTKNLCVSDESGAKTCITKSQLDALLSGQTSGGSSYTPPPTPPENEPEPETIEPNQEGEGGSEPIPEENTDDIAPETEEVPQPETPPSEEPTQ